MAETLTRAGLLAAPPGGCAEVKRIMVELGGDPDEPARGFFHPAPRTEARRHAATSGT
ncbi:hypothetical protein MUG60_10260 [Kaistella montana]|nr:hypothetical protein [Kaistella montana]